MSSFLQNANKNVLLLMHTSNRQIYLMLGTTSDNIQTKYLKNLSVFFGWIVKTAWSMKWWCLSVFINNLFLPLHLGLLWKLIVTWWELSIFTNFVAPCVLDDMLIKLWDWDKKWTCTQVFEGHTHYVMQIVINPKDNNTFASASLDRTVKVTLCC